MVTEASRATVARYLEKAYDLSGVDLSALLNKHRQLIVEGEWVRSAAYYVGDQIADLEGLVENPDYDEDAGEEDDDEDEEEDN